MATETSPRSLPGERRSPAHERRSEGLKPVAFLHDADGNWVLPPFPMFEVERREPTAARQPQPRHPGRGLWAWAVAGLLAPFAVLLGVLALPVSDTVRGVVLAGGWVLLVVVARGLETRRRHRR